MKSENSYHVKISGREDVEVIFSTILKKESQLLTMITKEFDIKKRTFNFAITTIRFCHSVQQFEKEYIITKQLMRSSTSVGANVRESRHAQSNKDFIHKLSIAQKECDETSYWLEIVYELYPNHKSEVEVLLKESRELLNILSSMILTAKKSLSKS